MARGNTAASVSTTIGAATATLVVMGAILVWPTVSACTSDAAGFGSCLRGILAERGVMGPEDIGHDRPTGPDVPAPPIPVAPGWLDAQAAQIVPDTPAAVDLVATPAGPLAGGPSGVSAPTPRVVLAPATELDARIASLDEKLSGSAQLIDPRGALSALGPVSAAEPPTARVALIGPLGAIAAQRVTPPVTAGTVLLPNGDAGRLTVSPPAAADAAGEPLAIVPIPKRPALPTLPVETPSDPVELTAAVTPSPVAMPPAASRAEEPAPALSFDPAFPNVLVLPSPATGENSSIRTLTLD